MNAEELRAYAEKLVADWPPLTDAQRARLTVLLYAGPVAAPAKPRRPAAQDRRAA